MKDSSKQVWIARLLAILVMSLGVAFISYITLEEKLIFKNRIVIKANENVGEILAAVKKLGRDDIQIEEKYVRTWWYNKKAFFLSMGAWSFLFFSIILAIYHAIYCIINCLLTRKEKEDILIKPTS